jgi:hypothetical protein
MRAVDRIPEAPFLNDYRRPKGGGSSALIAYRNDNRRSASAHASIHAWYDLHRILGDREAVEQALNAHHCLGTNADLDTMCWMNIDDDVTPFSRHTAMKGPAYQSYSWAKSYLTCLSTSRPFPAQLGARVGKCLRAAAAWRSVSVKSTT